MTTITDQTATHDGDVVTGIELVVLDMAGTTVTDGGAVERAFAAATERTAVADRLGREAALQYVRDTMGQSKIEVFRFLTGGDEAIARDANAAFEAAYAEVVADEGVVPIPGAERAIRRLRDAGIAVALTTGFSVETRDAVIDGLGWNDLVDLVLAPSDAGRGRPFPDMPLTAAIRCGVSTVDAMVVVGDTTSDVRSGLAAGAGLVVGVLSGAHDRQALEAAGAHRVIATVAALPALLGLDSPW